MRSTFSGFDIARKALVAHQQALSVTGHNIANAATPGYSRQRAALSASAPYTIPSMQSPTSSGQVGTGVEVTSIYRLRDEYTDFQYRSENQTLGDAKARWEMLDRVEGIFAEPTSAGLRATIGEFFNSWQDLSRDAASDTARAVVRQRGVAVADMFRHIRSQLDDTRVDLNEGIRLTVEDINSLADQISALNGQIQSSELHGYMANDLRDKRDLLVDQLSQLANIHVFDHDNQFAIVVNGTSLVRHQTVTHMRLSLTSDSEGNREVVWENTDGSDGLPVNAQSGRLGGLTTSRSRLQDGYIKALDELANEFAAAVNAQHAKGYYLPYGAVSADPTNWKNGEDLFVAVGTTATEHPVINAKNIKLNDLLTDTPEGRRMLAAAAGPEPVTGDGANALRLGQLRNQRIEGLNGTVEQRLEGILGVLGVDTQQVKRVYDNQTTLTEQLQGRRDSVSSVSLDEELTDMIRFQHAYSAAARLITTMDEVIDTLINRTGLR